MINLIGQQFGNYRLIRQLGKGGFGEVYLGRHIHIQRDAAIKLLLNLEQDEIEQFRQEAQIIAKLTHSRIVTIFDYDVAGDTPFIVMQYAEHGTLRGRYQRGTQVPLAEVVKYITQAAEGLQFAHDHQVVHRDIKPENMLLGPGGELLLSDFGIAVMWSGTRSIGTQDASGTLAYMPAEQILKHPRPASDQYALAITAYEWLSGARPMSESRMGLGIIQMQYPAVKAPLLQQLVPHLPQKVDDVLQRALSSDWQERFSTIREFAQELERAANPGSRPFQASYETQPDTQATMPTSLSLAPNLLPSPRLPQTLGYATIAPPPPPESYMAAPRQPAFAYPSPMVSFTPLIPAQSSLLRQTLALLGKILSIIGMIIGVFIALFGFLGIFAAFGDTSGAFVDVSLGGLLAFFGILVFFIARMRRSPIPITKARKVESTIGWLIGIIIILFSIGTIIALNLYPKNSYGYNFGRGDLIAFNVFTIIFGAVIWWVTRIRIKKTP